MHNSGNYPGAETTSNIATFLLLVPTLLHPQDSREAEGEVLTSVELSWAPEPSGAQVLLGGRDFPPVPEGWVGAARARWSFVVILKQTGFPSALCLLLASPQSCSLLCCGALLGVVQIWGALWGAERWERRVCYSHVVPDVSGSAGWGFQVLLGLGQCL